MKDDNAGIGQDLNTKLRNWYFGKCPEIPDWHSKIEDKCKTKGYVENIFGREMWFLNKDTPTRLNQAIASIPQSTIADLTNHGLVNIEENYKDMFFGTINNEEEIKKYFKEDKSSAHCLLQVHDALAGQYHKDDLNALDIIRKSMLIELPYPDKLIVPVDIKTSPISYGDCH